MATTETKVILSAQNLASRVLEKVQKGLEKIGDTARIVSRRLETIKRGATVAVAGLLTLTTAVGALAGIATNTTANYERLEIALETSLGTADKASKAFEEINQFSSKTPYQVEQVTNAFIKLNNYGLKTGERALTSYGDTASAMGKTLDDMVEAVADATVGEFERLKEFGIRSSVEGNRVRFTFRGITTEVGKNAQEIEEYLLRLGEVNFAGGMERQSKTFLGRLSTLRDQVSLFAVWLTEESGLFDFAKSGLEASSRLVSGLRPLIELMTKGEYSEGLNEAFGWAENSKIVANILKIREGLSGLFVLMGEGSYTSNLASAFGWAEDSNAVDFLLKIRETLVAISDWAMSSGIPAFIEAISHSWDLLMQGIKAFMEGLMTPFLASWDFLVGLFNSSVVPAFQSLMPELQRLWDIIEPYLLPTLESLGYVLGVVLVGALILSMATLAGMIRVVEYFARVTSDSVELALRKWEIFKNIVKAYLNAGAEDFRRFLLVVKDIQNLFSIAVFAMEKSLSQAFSGITSGINGAIGSFKQLIGVAKSAENIGSGAASRISGGLRLPSFDVGTSHFSGGLAKVHKDEIVQLPAGSKVRNASTSQRMESEMGGSTQNFNISINIENKSNRKMSRVEQLEFVEEIKEGLTTYFKQNKPA